MLDELARALPGRGRNDDLRLRFLCHELLSLAKDPGFFASYHSHVLLIAAALVVGLVLGWVRGGRLRHLADRRIVFWPAIPIALALQLAPIPELGTTNPELVPVGALLFSYVILIAVAVVNWRLPAFPLILVGLLLNFVAIGANEGMPVSREAIERAGLTETFPDLENDSKHHLQRPSDELIPITDVIPIPGPLGTVVSIGDVLMYVGAAGFIAFAMTEDKRRSRREQAVRVEAASSSGF